LPVGFNRLIAWCLRKDPQRRIQHTDDVKLALEDLKTEWETAIQTKPVARSSKHHWRLVLALVSVALLAALALTAWLYLATRIAEPVFSVVPLTSYPGLESSPTFSPDGNQVAFSWNGEKQDNFDIYVKLIGTDPLRLTTNRAADSSPTWSPDGRWIAFVRTQRDRYSICLISPLGGPEVELVQARLLDESLALGQRKLAWSPDSKWLAYPERQTLQEPFGLFVVSWKHDRRNG
jgi:hypothetical protein